MMDIMNYYYQAPVKKRKPPRQRIDTDTVSGPPVQDVSSFVEVSTSTTTSSSAASSTECASDTSFEATAAVQQVTVSHI